MTKHEEKIRPWRRRAIRDAVYSSIPEFARLAHKAEYNYLAIGNSITVHPIVEYWWAEGGMAASRPENDYYHLVFNELKNRYKRVNSKAFNYYLWEVLSNNRAETYSLIDPFLIDSVNLITIQLSENCSDIETLEIDFSSLIQHISTKCPLATIIVVDDFWSDDKSKMKRNVCQKMGVYFVDLSDIRGEKEYKAGLGTIVMDVEGNEHIISHSGVADHPGDIGMRVIAERVLDKIE